MWKIYSQCVLKKENNTFQINTEQKREKNTKSWPQLFWFTNLAFLLSKIQHWSLNKGGWGAQGETEEKGRPPQIWQVAGLVSKETYKACLGQKQDSRSLLSTPTHLNLKKLYGGLTVIQTLISRQSQQHLALSRLPSPESVHESSGGHVFSMPSPMQPHAVTSFYPSTVQGKKQGREADEK